MRNAYLQRRGYFDVLVGSFTKASTVGDEWRDCIYHVSFLFSFSPWLPPTEQDEQERLKWEAVEREGSRGKDVKRESERCEADNE